MLSSIFGSLSIQEPNVLQPLEFQRSEIINAGKTGVEKFEAATNNFWDKAEEYIVKEKEIDRKRIPDTIEKLGEEAVHEVIKTLRKELDPEKLIQDIFNIEKIENPEIF